MLPAAACWVLCWRFAAGKRALLSVIPGAVSDFWLEIIGRIGGGAFLPLQSPVLVLRLANFCCRERYASYFVMTVHLLGKAPTAISHPSGTTTDLRLEQLEKAPMAIIFTLAGMSICARDVQPKKAPPLISVTP